MKNISNKSRFVTFLLAFFLGMAGAHRFYVGKIASGIVQLLLTLSVVGMIVSGVWVFIDWIYILTGEFTDSENKKIK